MRGELVEWAEGYQEHSGENSTSKWKSCSGHVGGFLRADWLADGAAPQKGSLDAGTVSASHLWNSQNKAHIGHQKGDCGVQEQGLNYRC